MKFLALFLLTASAQAAPATVEQLVQMLANNPGATLNANTLSTKDPVTFDVSNGKSTLSAAASPTEFFALVRIAAPVTTIQSGELTFVNDYGRLSVLKSDVKVFDLLQDVLDNQENPADVQPGDQGGNVGNTYRVLSVVGSTVSYSIVGDQYAPGAAHPNYTDTILTADVSTTLKTGDNFFTYAQANLGEMVDETSLVNALKADRFLRSKIASAADRKKLLAARNLQEIGDIAFDALQGSCYSLGLYEGKLTQFAIYDYDAVRNLVTVRIPMGASAHVCEGAAPTKQLGLIVKPRLELELALKDQIKAKNGLLMKNVK
jgi:hypothetical protein